MAWHGAYQIRTYLESCVEEDHDRPPESSGVYVVTQKRWRTEPNHRSGVLYIGGNTGQSARFRTRLGDLIADMLGFFGDSTGHHSGGRRLWGWCRTERINPLDLYIGWQSGVECHRCAEIDMFRELKPLLNKNRPPKCTQHC